MSEGTFGGIEQRLLAAVEAAGLDARGGLRHEQLGALDHFHTGGRKATQELLDLVAFGAEARVLDIGSAIGGPARMIASARGCYLTCVELSEELCRGARMLNRLTGLQDRIEVQQGDATTLPFAGGSFDVAWMQNVGMAVPDKGALYREVRRALRKNGRFAFQEVVAGNGPPHFPVPWARSASGSFLIGADELRRLLEGSGFAVELFEDVSGAELRRPPAGAAQGPLAIATWVEDMATKSRNSRRSLEEGRIGFVRGVLRAV